MTRVALVAASPAVRAGLATLLGAYPGFVVLETAARPADLADVAESLEADVLLVALEPGDPLPLPVRVPPDAAARTPPLLLLGGDATGGWALRAVRAGARGVLPRTATADQIAAAVSALAAGLAVVEAGQVGSPLPRPVARADPPVQSLTPRELEILAMLADGLGNKVIAARLAISEHTVKTHVAGIFAKLGVTTRAEAVATAARQGLLLL